MAATVMLVEATDEHVIAALACARAANLAEIRAATGKDPLVALRQTFDRSAFARAGYIDNRIAALFGVIDHGGCGPAQPWVFATEVVDRFPLTFWKASKVALREIRSVYPQLVQFVDVRFTRSLSWVRRLGFDVREPAPYGPARLPFRPIFLLEARA